jgi:hypothetical protein
VSVKDFAKNFTVDQNCSKLFKEIVCNVIPDRKSYPKMTVRSRPAITGDSNKPAPDRER